MSSVGGISSTGVVTCTGLTITNGGIITTLTTTGPSTSNPSQNNWYNLTTVSLNSLQTAPLK